MTMPFGDKIFAQATQFCFSPLEKHPIFILEWMGFCVEKKSSLTGNKNRPVFIHYNKLEQ